MKVVWAENFKSSTEMFKIFDYLRNSESARFSNEISEVLGLNMHTVLGIVKILSDRGMISRSDCLVRVPKTVKGNGYLYGINQKTIDKRIEAIKSGCGEYNTNRQKILTLLRDEDMGFTPVEIKMKISVDCQNHSISTECWRMFKDGLIKRSPFYMPNRLAANVEGKNVSVTGNMSVVYGKDMNTVFKGVFRLMPQTVKTALNYIQCSDVVYPSWVLTEKSKVSNENLKQWFKQGLCRVGLVKFKSLGNVSYYYNPRIPETIVEEQIANLREESRKWRLRITELGRQFERKAVWTYVEYLRSMSYDIKTTDDFPDHIPSYRNNQVRGRYVRESIDENGNNKVEWLNDVWKFDAEPLDYLVFVKDKNTGERTVHILTCKRDVCKRYGINYFVNFVGCVRMGRTRDGINIPGFLTARPVFVCGETFGQKLHRFNENSLGQAGLILTIEKMEKMLAAIGKVYPRQQEFERMLEAQKAYNLYSQHIDVLTGQKGIFEMLKDRGFEVDDATR